MGDTWGHGGDTHAAGSVPQPRAAPGARSGPTLSRLAVLIIPLVDKDSGAVVCVILVSAGTWAGLWGAGMGPRRLGPHATSPPPGTLRPAE